MVSSFGDQLVQLNAEILLFVLFFLGNFGHFHDLVFNFRFIGPCEVAVPSEELTPLSCFRFFRLF